MATLGEALRAYRAIGLPEPATIVPTPPEATTAPPVASLRLPRPPMAISKERRRLYLAIIEWLYLRWDFGDEAFTLEVYSVCSGSMMVWETWLDLAPLDKLARGLALIEAEHAYLGPLSPWRRPL